MFAFCKQTPQYSQEIPAKEMNSVKIVEEFWERVWKARNPAPIDDFVIEDFRGEAPAHLG